MGGFRAFLTKSNALALAIGIILGVDRFLDMCRTTLNVTGDLTLATLVARGEQDTALPEAAVP